MQMMKRTYKIPAVQLDNSALEVVDDTYRVLTTGEKPCCGKKCYWKNGEYIRKKYYFSTNLEALKNYMKKTELTNQKGAANYSSLNFHLFMLFCQHLWHMAM